jgi:hypothetical protein
MRQRVCGRKDAEQRLVDARQFLEAAEILDSPDVVATNAIHAARCVRWAKQLVDEAAKRLP